MHRGRGPVTKRSDSEIKQLTLDLAVKSRPVHGHVSEGHQRAAVVSFVDSATIALRRDAIQRVRESGIFSVPDYAPKRKA
jgi:hypothetical protein